MSKRKVSTPTEIVQRAQGLYPERLRAVKAYLSGPAPYGKQLLDPRTADRRLVEMPMPAFAQLAATDPVAAEQAAQRIQTLDARASALPRYPDKSED